MDLSRRRLFSLGAAAVLTAVVTSVAPAEATPTFWGDGIHDDSDALQAIFDGKPVRVANEHVIVDDGLVRDARIRLSKTVYIRDKAPVSLVGCHIEADVGFQGKTLIHVGELSGENPVAIMHCVFRCENVNP